MPKRLLRLLFWRTNGVPHLPVVPAAAWLNYMLWHHAEGPMCDLLQVLLEGPSLSRIMGIV
jgi:hypothetical protein